MSRNPLPDDHPDMRLVGIRFEPEQRRWLEQIAVEEDRSIPWIVRRIVRQAMAAAGMTGKTTPVRPQGRPPTVTQKRTTRNHHRVEYEGDRA